MQAEAGAASGGRGQPCGYCSVGCACSGGPQAATTCLAGAAAPFTAAMAGLGALPLGAAPLGAACCAPGLLGAALVLRRWLSHTCCSCAWRARTQSSWALRAGGGGGRG